MIFQHLACTVVGKHLEYSDIENVIRVAGFPPTCVATAALLLTLCTHCTAIYRVCCLARWYLLHLISQTLGTTGATWCTSHICACLEPPLQRQRHALHSPAYTVALDPVTVETAWKSEGVVQKGICTAMGILNSCIRLSKGVLSSPTGASSDSKLHVTAPAASESERAATCSSSPALPPACTERTMERVESENRSVVEERIESSKVHWSLLAKHEEDDAQVEMSKEEEELVNASNVKVFKTLKSHSTWGHFFGIFGDAEGFDFRSLGELEVGWKFAEGAQAELFHTHITWNISKQNEWDEEHGTEWVLKVFKKGTLLQDLQPQWPHGLFQVSAERLDCTKLGKPQHVRNYCQVFCATLVKDGRFGFVMVKEEEDLRSVIDRKMSTNIHKNPRPFQKDFGGPELIMYRIALGMDQLHRYNIVHRDLKASNVLLKRGNFNGDWLCSVADYECSIGVVGTGFWRAPEILQACKEKNVSTTPELFTKQADVYSYGMTCYEILTGKIPFDGHPWSDYDLVCNGNQPEVPEHVDDWAHGLLNWCWQSNPIDRPLFGDILNLLEANSAIVRESKLLWEQVLEEEELWLKSRVNEESVRVEA